MGDRRQLKPGRDEWLRSKQRYYRRLSVEDAEVGKLSRVLSHTRIAKCVADKGKRGFEVLRDHLQGLERAVRDDKNPMNLTQIDENTAREENPSSVSAVGDIGDIDNIGEIPGDGIGLVGEVDINTTCRDTTYPSIPLVSNHGSARPVQSDDSSDLEALIEEVLEKKKPRSNTKKTHWAMRKLEMGDGLEGNCHRTDQ